MSGDANLPRLKAVFQRLVSNIGVLETSLWGAGVVLSIVNALANRLAPAALPVGDIASVASVLRAGGEFAQIGAFVLAAGIRVVKIIGVRNPAQALLRFVRRGGDSAHLYHDLYDLLAKDQVRFNRDVLEYVDKPADVEEISLFNSRSFARSMSYGGDLEKKRQRNAPILERCPTAFAFVVHDGRRIGFSSVVPLTSNFYDLYVAGKVSDHDIMPEMIPEVGAPAGCLLLFAIGLLPEYEQADGDRKTQRYFSALLRAHGLHIRESLETYGAADTPLVIQAEKASIIRAVRHFGFKGLQNRGADGDRLFEAKPSAVAAALGRRIQRKTARAPESTERMTATA